MNIPCPCCGKKIEDVEEFFDNEVSADADVDGTCEHCDATLRFARRLEYSVKIAPEGKRPA